MTYKLDVVMVSGIDPRVTRPGGTRSYVLSLISLLKRMGHDTLLVGAKYPVKARCKMRYIGLPLSRPSSFRFFFKLLLEVPYLRLSSKQIFHFHRVEEALPFVIYWPRNPKVLTLHGIPIKGIRQRNGKLVTLLYSIVEDIVIDRMDEVIPVSSEGREYLLENYGRSGTLIPVGVDMKLFRKTGDTPGKTPRILFVGRFEKEKGIDHIARLAGNGDWEVAAAGSGPMEHLLRNAGVRVLGRIPREKMPHVYSSADVLVLPSSYEGLPTVVLEALACETPVVAFDVGDISKVVDRTVGRISTPGRLERDVRAVLNDPPSGEACRKRAEEYSWENIAGRIVEVYYRVKG